MTTDKTDLDAILRNDLQGFIEKTFNTVVSGQTYLMGMLSPLRPYNAGIAGQEDGRSETFRCRSGNAVFPSSTVISRSSGKAGLSSSER